LTGCSRVFAHIDLSAERA